MASLWFLAATCNGVWCILTALTWAPLKRQEHQGRIQVEGGVLGISVSIIVGFNKKTVKMVKFISNPGLSLVC